VTTGVVASFAIFYGLKFLNKTAILVSCLKYPTRQTPKHAVDAYLIVDVLNSFLMVFTPLSVDGGLHTLFALAVIPLALQQ
jgi:hypothetical protein